LLIPLALASFAVVAGVSLGVPRLRPTWKGTTTHLGTGSNVGVMVFLLSFAAASSTGERLALIGVPVGFSLMLGGFAQDTGANLRRIAVLVAFGIALVLGLLFTFRFVLAH
jgi:hypothetical protein